MGKYSEIDELTREITGWRHECEKLDAEKRQLSDERDAALQQLQNRNNAYKVNIAIQMQAIKRLETQHAEDSELIKEWSDALLKSTLRIKFLEDKLEKRL